MGADLYIKAVHDPIVKKYESRFEKAVERRNASAPDSKESKTAQRQVEKYYNLMHGTGYFRDSYNATSVIEKLGLSWWRDCIPLLTEEQKLEGANLKLFRDKVANAKLTLPTRKELKDRFIRVNDAGEDSLSDWHKYYIEKHKALIAFLERAIELNTAIHCSL